MKPYDKVLRAAAYKLLPHVPLKWSYWFRDRAVLNNVLKALSINCVLDVGANRGQYGLSLREMGYRGHIVSFEPVAENYEALEQVASQRAPWKTFNYALGAEDERKTINVTKETVFSSFLEPVEESEPRFHGNHVARKEEVGVRRLDGVLDACLEGISSPRIYLKLDTQGFDLAVMKGGKSILPRILALQTEASVHNIYRDMTSFVDSISRFQELGFEVIDFITVNRDIDQLCALEVDCIMTRKPMRVQAKG